MRLLLDTHALLWWLADDPKLPQGWQRSISDPENDVLVSAISLAEISIKVSMGKLTAPLDLTDALVASGLDPLPLTWDHACELGRLPWYHRDPFDRMLIAQARVESLVLATTDPHFQAYEVDLLATDT